MIKLLQFTHYLQKLNLQDFRIANFDAPPITEARIDNEIPRIQSCAETTDISSTGAPAVIVSVLLH